MARKYLAIIPQARMGYESKAHEAEGRMGYWLGGYEGERRNNCFRKIQLVGQKNIESKHFSQVKATWILFYRQNITNVAGAFRC